MGRPLRDVMHLQATLATVRNLGFELHSHSADDRVLYLSGGYKTASVGMSPKERYPYQSTTDAKGVQRVKHLAGEMDSEKLIMTPPLLPTAEAVELTKAEWQKTARKQFESGARMIGIDDERRMSGDFDFSPQTLAGFRRWLQGRYANVAALNRTWGSRFADFGQVVPKRRTELGDSPNLAPWLEFRMYIGDVLGQYYMKAPADWAAEISPDLSVGEWGIYEPSADFPIDWHRYAGCYKFTCRYGNNQGVIEEWFRSFAPGTRHGMWQGYGMRHISPGRRISLWQSLLNGGSFAWFWEMCDPGSLNYAFCRSDQQATAGYVALGQQELPDMTGGIDRLVIASRFTDDKIAVGYSYPSWVADGAAKAEIGKVIVEELGYQHTFFDIDDVAAGRLQREGYRLLLLQQTGCLSAEQVAGLQRFVESGGTLLCVGRIGWRDLHGAALRRRLAGRCADGRRHRGRRAAGTHDATRH